MSGNRILKEGGVLVTVLKCEKSESIKRLWNGRKTAADDTVAYLGAKPVCPVRQDF